MKRTGVRLVTALFVAGGVALGLVPLAAAEEAKLIATAEGWYQPDPSCAQDSGCLLANVPADVSGMLVTNPYPAGTLHVGYTGGQETARSVLAFPVSGVTGTLTGAKLDVPLDVDPANGDAQSTTAKVQVCLVTGEITAAAGSVAAPPATSCDTRALMTYVATPKPHLTADLAPLLAGLPTTSGIALLPDATAATETDAWHVTFSAKDRAAATTGPATLTVTTTDGTITVDPTLPPVAEVPDVPSGGGGFAALPDTGTGFGQAPTVELPVDVAPLAPSVSTPVTTPAVVPTAQTVTFGYAYPIVWLLPLAFLVLIPMAARALTQDLAPV